MTVRCHTTDQAGVILRDGFRDAPGFGYGFVGIEVPGVFVSRWPLYSNDGAKGDQVLEISFPDDLDLEPYEVAEEGFDVCEWVLPAEMINRCARVRLLTNEDLDAR